MRWVAIPLLLAAAAWAGPKKVPVFVPTAAEAVEIARTRGKLILLTVVVDHDAENRTVVEQVLRDPAFLKIAPEFVLLYANSENDHGTVKMRRKDGRVELRCADCPSITCEDHMDLALKYARAFYPTSDCRTPVHFVLNAEEKVVDTIMNGTFEQGFNHVPAKVLVGRLKKLLQKYGRGLTEKEYRHMLELLTDARAARARGNVTLELQKLLEVVALDREVEGVKKARERVREIDTLAAAELRKVDALVEGAEWEAALDALRKICETYPGTPTCAAAKKKSDALQERKEVKRLLKALALYERAVKFRDLKKYELAKKYFAKCARLYPETRYGKLSKEALALLDRG